jgi:orotidine-5'-phosphate decarboxylase
VSPSPDPVGPGTAVHPADRIVAVSEASGSLACVGLDPRPELIPPVLCRAALDRHGDGAAAVADAFLAFNLGVLDAVAGRCAAVKPQVACYEAYGSAGWRTLEATVTAARERGIPVIIDGKRNDIGSTATHYAQAAFGGAPGLDGAVLPGMGGDWLTVNGYLGTDGVEPFLGPVGDPAAGGHGVFVLVRTSNPSASDLQDQVSGDGTVADRMADLVARWGAERRGSSGLTSVGAVVGATWPDQARALRARMADTLFLVPGYGAQGGSAADALAGARPAGHPGLIVNSSRQILAAWQHDDADDWVGSARRAVEAMNADLGTART